VNRRALPRRRRTLSRNERRRRFEQHGDGLRPNERTPAAGSCRRRASPWRVFRDDEHRDVLLLIDNIFRFIQPHGSRRPSWRNASRLGYQSTMGTIYRPRRAHRQYACGAITSIQAVYVPADDLTDPAAVHVFSHLPHPLSCRANGQAKDSIRDRSAPVQFEDGDARHCWRPALQPCQEIRRTLAQYESLKTLWPCLAWNSFLWKIGTLLHELGGWNAS